MKRVVWISLILIYSQNWAQQKVTNKLYQATLSVLLSHSVPEISINKAQQQVENTLFLDARELKEYQVSHIPNAKHVGYDSFNLNKVSEVSKEQPIIVYCSVGYRSEKIAKKLLDIGYTNVSNMYGGIFEWVNNNHTIVKQTHKTDSIHSYNKIWGKWITNKEIVKVYH